MTTCCRTLSASTHRRHLLALINDVLDLSKIEAGKMEVFPTNFDIENVVEMLTAINTPLSEKTGNAFVIEQDEISGTMYSDETKLRQILTNFLSNGFKNTRKALLLCGSPLSDGSNREMIRFSVIDTGPVYHRRRWQLCSTNSPRYRHLPCRRFRPVFSGHEKTRRNDGRNRSGHQ